MPQVANLKFLEEFPPVSVGRMRIEEWNPVLVHHERVGVLNLESDVICSPVVRNLIFEVSNAKSIFLLGFSTRIAKQ